MQTDWIGSPSLFDIRLVLFVQLNTHLSDRLRTAMIAYLSELKDASIATAIATKTIDVSVLENGTGDG